VSLSDLFSRRRKEPADSDAGASDAPVHPTKVLARFVASLSARTQPVLLDLGPVVGSNVSFFGEQLGCKIIVEDLSKDIDRHVREGKLEDLPAALSKRFPHPSASIDGILCWDVFDYLDKNSAKKLAEQLTRILKPEGVLLAFFVTAEPQPGAKPEYTRHIVIDPRTFSIDPMRRRVASSARCRTATSSACSRNCASPNSSCSRATFAKCCFRKPAEAPPTTPPATR
jgi:SAM-dependent methyltransferase